MLQCSGNSLCEPFFTPDSHFIERNSLGPSLPATNNTATSAASDSPSTSKRSPDQLTFVSCSPTTTAQSPGSVTQPAGAVNASKRSSHGVESSTAAEERVTSARQPVTADTAHASESMVPVMNARRLVRPSNAALVDNPPSFVHRQPRPPRGMHRVCFSISPNSFKVAKPFHHLNNVASDVDWDTSHCPFLSRILGASVCMSDFLTSDWLCDIPSSGVSPTLVAGFHCANTLNKSSSRHHVHKPAVLVILYMPSSKVVLKAA